MYRITLSPSGRKLLLALAILFGGLLSIHIFKSIGDNGGIIAEMRTMSLNIDDSWFSLNTSDISRDFRSDPIRPNLEDRSRGTIISRDVDAEEEEWNRVQNERLNLMYKYCQDHKGIHQYSKRMKQRFGRETIVDNKRRVMFCPIGKVACTSWKTAMAIIQGHYTGLKPGEHIHDAKVLVRNDLGTLSMSNSQAVNRYTSFMFVRHPFERLVSAFVNKLSVEPEIWQLKYGRHIISKYRQESATEEELKTGRWVKFPEFIKWVLEEPIFDVHTDTYNDVCMPCRVKYSYLGKMETFQQDTKYIMKNLFKSNDTDNFPQSNASDKKSRDRLETYFRSVSQEDVDKLLRKYDMDFKMYNYTWPL